MPSRKKEPQSLDATVYFNNYAESHKKSHSLLDAIVAAAPYDHHGPAPPLQPLL